MSLEMWGTLSTPQAACLLRNAALSLDLTLPKSLYFCAIVWEVRRLH